MRENIKWNRNIEKKTNTLIVFSMNNIPTPKQVIF